MNIRRFLLILFIGGFTSCKKEAKNIDVSYQLDTSSITGDHFYVTYINATGDTLKEHQHPGWNYSFKTTKPYSLYAEAEVMPVDTYDFTLKILVDGRVVREQSASTASGSKQTIKLEYKEN